MTRRMAPIAIAISVPRSLNATRRHGCMALGWTLDKMPLFLEGVARAAAKLGVTPVPPGSMIGVSVLFDPDILVEVEATAVLD